jgi:hypothetical protein
VLHSRDAPSTYIKESAGTLKITDHRPLLVLLWVGVLVIGRIATAQEVLPRPEQPFKGHIGRTVKDSTKDFPTETSGPQGRAQRPAHSHR